MSNIANRLQTAFPPMPESFGQAVDHTLASLPARVSARKHERGVARFALQAAMVIGIVAGVSGCVFFVRPALAAQIPVVNDIIYNLSPTLETSEEQRQTMIGVLEQHIKISDNYSLAVNTISATQKGFMFDATIQYELMDHGKAVISEKAEVRFIEDIDGMHIISHEVIFRHELNENAGILPAPSITDGMLSAEMSLEYLAAELCYRFWIASKEQNVPEMSDIMVLNSDTELWLLDLQLKIETIKLKVSSPVITVSRGNAEVVEIIYENDTTIKANMRVKTFVDGGAGEEIVLTISKDSQPMIIGIDRIIGDGTYINELKPLVEQYMGEGLERSAANNAAYAKVLENRKQFAKEHPEYLLGAS